MWFIPLFNNVVDKNDFDKALKLYDKLSKMYDELEDKYIKEMQSKETLLNTLIELKKDLDADNYNYRLSTLNNIESVTKSFLDKKQ